MIQRTRQRFWKRPNGHRFHAANHVGRAFSGSLSGVSEVGRIGTGHAITPGRSLPYGFACLAGTSKWSFSSHWGVAELGSDTRTMTPSSLDSLTINFT